MALNFPHYSIGDFINDPRNLTQLEVLIFGQMEEPQVEDLHKHTFYEVIWVEEGESTQNIDFQQYNVSCGSLFFISPGQIHRFEEWNHLKGGSLLFTSDFFLFNRRNASELHELIFLDNSNFSPSFQPEKNSFVEIVHTIELITQENRRPTVSHPMLHGYLYVLMAQIQRCIETTIKQPSSRSDVLLYKQFQKILESNYQSNQAPRFFADQLNITPHHLNSVVKSVTGKTTSEVIRDRGVLEAKRMFAFSEMSVSQVALELAYFDSSHFAKVFKQSTGRSPMQFKSEISQSYRIL